MSARLGTWQAGQLYDNFKSRLKEYTEDNITPESFLDILNMNVDEYVSLSGLLDSEEYKDSFEIIPADGKKQYWEWSAVTVSGSNKILTFTAGNYLKSPDVTNLTNPLFTGGKVIINPDISATGLWQSYVKRVISALSVELAEAIPSDIIAFNSSPGMILAPGGVDEVHLGALEVYKNIDRIILINSNLYAEAINKPLAEFRNITDPSKYPAFSSYRNKIIYTRDGEYLYFKKGNLSAYGEITLHFIRTPYHCTALTDLVDLRDANINIVQDNNLLDGLQVLKVPMPQDMANAQSRRQEMRSAKNEELAKNFERKD